MAMQYLGFPVEEMQKKLDNARALMEEQNLSGLLLTATANYYYFTGIRKLADWATFTRPVFLLLPRKKEPVLYVQNFGYPECRSRSFVQDIRSFPDLMTTPLEGLVSIMKELDMDKGKVGCELGYEQRMDMPVAAFLQLKDMLPNATFVDAAQLLWQLRMVKMPYEIECMREANRIAAAAFESCFTSIHEGMTEREVARKLVASMAEHGADLPGFIIVISGTGNYDRISARPTDRIIRKGDLVWIDAGTTYKGYWTDWCRAGVVGKPSEEQRRLQAIIHETTMLGADRCPRSAGGGYLAGLRKVYAGPRPALELRLWPGRPRGGLAADGAPHHRPGGRYPVAAGHGDHLRAGLLQRHRLL